MWNIHKMSRTFFKCLLVHWKTFAIFVIPSLLLPVAFIDGTATFRCAYVALIMALFWYIQSSISCNFSPCNKLPYLIKMTKFIYLTVKQFSISFIERYKRCKLLCSGCLSFYPCQWRLWFPWQSSLLWESCQPTKLHNVTWKIHACSTLEVSLLWFVYCLGGTFGCF